MKYLIFLIITFIVLSNASSLSKEEVQNATHILRPASQIPISWLLKNTPKKRLTSFHGILKQVPGCGVAVVSRIFGGVKAVPKEFPWQALVVVQNDVGQYFGGGSLINQYWVLTAGHLTFGGRTGWAELGSNDKRLIEADQMNIGLAEILTHPQYQGADHNDIGLVRLVSPAPYTEFIRPICLPNYSDFIGGGELLTISGWGSIETGSPDILQKASVTSMTTADCAATGLQNIDDTKICTTAEQGTGVCSGDSGGPLSLVAGGKTFSVGITSFGVGGCGSILPDGFTRTTAYLTWISSTTGIYIDP